MLYGLNIYGLILNLKKTRVEMNRLKPINLLLLAQLIKFYMIINIDSYMRKIQFHLLIRNVAICFRKLQNKRFFLINLKNQIKIY